MAERLRIALVAPIAQAVARDSPSSIEQLVAVLCDGLAARGHEVTLFATGDSRVAVPVHATYPRGYHAEPSLWDNWEFHEVCNAAEAVKRAAEFDLIHTHAYHYALPLAGLVGDTALVSTFHVNPDRDVLAAYASRPQVRVVAVSDYHRAKFRGLDRVAVIPNGIDVTAFPEGAGGDYLLFLGHLIEKKGPLEAIGVARAAGMPLVMAGSCGAWAQTQVAPLVDGVRVRCLGKVDAVERNRLLAGAAALVFTSVRAEPFGLVMVEAMACGTPVAALDRCAVREIVTPGVTGHYRETVEDLAELIPGIVALDRGRVRAEAAARFDAVRMVAAHEALYREAVGADARPQHARLAAPATATRHDLQPSPRSGPAR